MSRGEVSAAVSEEDGAADSVVGEVDGAVDMAVGEDMADGADGVVTVAGEATDTATDLGTAMDTDLAMLILTTVMVTDTLIMDTDIIVSLIKIDY